MQLAGLGRRCCAKPSHRVVNHIDTSNYYEPYLVNELIRQTLAPYSDNLVLVTKIGARRAGWLILLSEAIGRLDTIAA